jgi:hypothetical protein
MTGKLWQENKTGEAVVFGEHSCVWARECLAIAATLQKDVPDTDVKFYDSLKDQFFRRYELLAACQQKLGNRKVSCNSHSSDD